MTTNKYIKGKIYKLVNNVDDNEYVGSTITTLTKRKWGHKSEAKRHEEQKVYKHLNSIGWNTVEIILVENFPCNTKDELTQRERYWIDRLKPELNKIKPSKNNKEYNEDEIVKTYEASKEKIKEHDEVDKEKVKEYLKEQHAKNYKPRVKAPKKAVNKEALKEQRRLKYPKQKEAINERRRQRYDANKDKHKQYYEENKEAITERQRQRHTANKDAINERQRQNYHKKKQQAQI